MDLSPPRLKSLPAWTPWRDDLALSDRTVGARMRFLFTPVRAPSLSAAGARAGIGPDGAARERPNSPDVDTRPDPRLDRPIASRLADDISEAAQITQAERMGLHMPVKAPELSATGAKAGLGGFGPNSSSKRAKLAAAMSDLAMSVSKVRMAAQKTTAMQSGPIAQISDASGKVGITGRNPIPAAGRGSTMRVPKSPVAQDRERWASGTSDRIAGASKGLSLANLDWGDHRGAPAKPQAKRTWVGKQGDATECPENCTEACTDLAVAPHAAVNKAWQLRELQKERAVSDVCPPLTSSTGTLEMMLARDRHLAATAPEALRRTWASRPPVLRSTTRTGSLKPTLGATRGFPELSAGAASGKRCGCSDCGCETRPKAYLTEAGWTVRNTSAVGVVQQALRANAGFSLYPAGGRFNQLRTPDPLPQGISGDSMHVTANSRFGGVASNAGLQINSGRLEEAIRTAPPPLVDRRLLALIVQKAIDNVDNSSVSPELIWLTVAAEAAAWDRVPTALPDPDLFRAIVAVAQRKGTAYRDRPDLILDYAIREPLHVEPELLKLIVEHSRWHEVDPTVAWDFTEDAITENKGVLSRRMSASNVWYGAWKKRLEKPGVPTPPDLDLFLKIREWAFSNPGEPATILRYAHGDLTPVALWEPAVWPPPRQIPREAYRGFLWRVLVAMGDSSDAPTLSALEELRQLSASAVPWSARNQAWSDMLQALLTRSDLAEYNARSSRHKLDTLWAGQWLSRGTLRQSNNGRAALHFQDDGNLVLYELQDDRRRVLWTAATGPGRDGALAEMQESDGNFVVYDRSGNAMWASGTSGHPGAWLVVQDDGNVVIYGQVDEHSYTDLWSTKTSGFQQNLPSSSSASACDLPFIGEFCAAGQAFGDWFEGNIGSAGAGSFKPGVPTGGDAPGGGFGWELPGGGFAPGGGKPQQASTVYAPATGRVPGGPGWWDSDPNGDSQGESAADTSAGSKGNINTPDKGGGTNMAAMGAKSAVPDINKIYPPQEQQRGASSTGSGTSSTPSGGTSSTPSGGTSSPPGGGTPPPPTQPPPTAPWDPYGDWSKTNQSPGGTPWQGGGAQWGGGGTSSSGAPSAGTPNGMSPPMPQSPPNAPVPYTTGSGDPNNPWGGTWTDPGSSEAARKTAQQLGLQPPTGPDTGAAPVGAKGGASQKWPYPNRDHPQNVSCGTYGTRCVNQSGPLSTFERSVHDWAILFAITMNADHTVAHGSDTSREWFVPVFQRGDTFVAGQEQSGPPRQGTAPVQPWDPNPYAGQQSGDILVTTIHTHLTNPDPSTNDLASADATDTPMVIITPNPPQALRDQGATQLLRIYYPESRHIVQWPFP